MTPVWWLGLVGLLLLAPQVVLAFFGRIPVWARLLAALGVTLVGYSWWRQIGGVEGVRSPFVAGGLFIGATLPFLIAWLVVRARTGSDAGQRPSADDGEGRR